MIVSLNLPGCGVRVVDVGSEAVVNGSEVVVNGSEVVVDGSVVVCDGLGSEKWNLYIGKIASRWENKQSKLMYLNIPLWYEICANFLLKFSKRRIFDRFTVGYIIEGKSISAIILKMIILKLYVKC